MPAYILVFILISTVPSYAYLDGGTSSMLLQLLFGGVAGGLVFIKMYWKKLISSFKKDK